MVTVWSYAHSASIHQRLSTTQFNLELELSTTVQYSATASRCLPFHSTCLCTVHAIRPAPFVFASTPGRAPCCAGAIWSARGQYANRHEQLQQAPWSQGAARSSSRTGQGEASSLDTHVDGMICRLPHLHLFDTMARARTGARPFNLFFSDYFPTQREKGRNPKKK